MELRATRKEQQQLTGVLKAHMDGCGEQAIITAAKLGVIEERFQRWDRLIDFLAKYGKWLAGTIFAAFVGAFASLYAQNYYQHQQVQQTANVAAVAAKQVATGQSVVLHKLNEIAPGP
jgi:hypothetical protein